MFTVTEEPLEPFTVYKLLNEDTGEYASIVPGYGAILYRLALFSDAEELIQVTDGFKNGEHIAAEGSRLFKGNLLFPFPNRIKDGKYAFAGENYQLPINETGRGHALHGLLHNANFDVVAQGASPSGAFLILEYESDGKNPGYPFQYILNLDFRLTDEGFSCKTVVQNLEEREIPVGIGFHPYFKLSGQIDDWLLKLPIRSQLQLDERMIPTGEEHIPARYQEFTPIGADSLDDAFTVGSDKGKVITQVYDPKSNVRLSVWQRTGQHQFNYLQVYTPKTRDSIAIEPMTGAPDAFNNGQGLILLKPEQVLEAEFGVQIE